VVRTPGGGAWGATPTGSTCTIGARTAHTPSGTGEGRPPTATFAGRTEWTGLSSDAGRDGPDYLHVDHKLLKATFLRSPKLADVPYPVQMEPNRVIEYYSH